MEYKTVTQYLFGFSQRSKRHRGENIGVHKNLEKFDQQKSQLLYHKGPPENLKKNALYVTEFLYT